MSERKTRDFWVTVTGERAAEWRQVLGTDTVAVLSPIPHRADLPGRPGALIHLMDLGALTGEQVGRLTAHLATKFGLPIEEVQAGLAEQGVPILADDCMVAVHNPQRWF